MAKNIEKQGIRVGYIIGGIAAVLLAALLIVLYLPVFLTLTFGIEPLWDLCTPIAELVGTNFMDYFETWGAAGIMVLCFLIYFVCMAARQSKSATMFRLTGMFGALGCSLPFVSTAILAMGLVDLSAYVGYGMIGTFALALIFYIIGLILRAKQKFHKNRATTALVFCVTFWLALSAIMTVYYVGVTFNIDALVTTLTPVMMIITLNIFTILAIYLLISAIWMFLTIPHRVVVEYNVNTPSLEKPMASPAEQANQIQLTPAEEAMAKQKSAEAINGAGAPVTQPLNVYPDKQGRAMPNPYRRKPIQPIPTTPQMAQPRQFATPQTNPNMAAARPTVQPYGAQANQSVITPQTPYNPSYPNALPNQYQRAPMQNQAQNFNIQPRAAAQPQQPMNSPYPYPMPNRPTPMQQPAQTVQPMRQPIQQQQPMQPLPFPRPTVQAQSFNRAQPIRPMMPNTPNMAPNMYNPNLPPRPAYPQQPNVANNPNNFIPNNIRPINGTNNPNNPNNNGTNNNGTNNW